MRPPDAAPIVRDAPAEDKRLQDRPALAAAHVVTAMTVIGFIDQYIGLLSERSSLWTFHMLRTVLVVALAAIWLRWRGEGLRVRRWRPVLVRSALLATAMMLYFGSLGFVPVAQSGGGAVHRAALGRGLRPAPVRPMVGPVRMLAAAAGFGGVLLVLAPGQGDAAWPLIAPVAAGAFYALAALATRNGCEGESALTLALGGFGMLGLFGLAGVVVVSVAGAGDGYLTRASSRRMRRYGG